MSEDETIDRNYFDLLKAVIEDNKSGAREVAQKTVVCLETFFKDNRSSDHETLLNELEKIAKQILKTHPRMAQLINLFNKLFVAVENEPSSDVQVYMRKLLSEVKRFDELARSAVEKIAEFGAALIKNDYSVLVHSNSSTIFEIISKAQAQGKIFSVFVAESRPVNEGRIMAKRVSALGITNTYFVDAAIARGVDRSDLVLLGGDAVSEISLVNKIGSTAICLLAKEALVPCYVACESSKFLPQKLMPTKEILREPHEVWSSPPPETTIENYYFEETDLNLFQAIVTEEGTLKTNEIEDRIRKEKMSARIFHMLR